MSRCVKVDTLGRRCDDNLERLYNHFITTNIYLIGAAYNFYFLIIYKPSSLIISPQTFSMQLGAGTAWFCLSQCAIPFCTLLPQIGSRNQANPWSRAQVVKGISPVSVRASRVGCLPRREPLYQTNLTLEIPYRSPRLH